jgi:2'-5' RNA ligase
MSAMRLFIAVPLEDRARTELASAGHSLRRSLGRAADDLRWSSPEQAHLTLHFLGDVGAPNVDVLLAALRAPVPEPPFNLTLEGFGAFPPSGAVRVVWMGIAAGAGPLARVHEEIGRRLTSAGFVLEARPFTPHLTLARARGGRPGAGGALRRALAGVASPRIASRVEAVTLMQSDLSGPRPRYAALATMPLTGL